MSGQYIADRVHGSGGRIVLLRFGHFGLDVSDFICSGRHFGELLWPLLGLPRGLKSCSWNLSNPILLGWRDESRQGSTLNTQAVQLALWSSKELITQFSTSEHVFD